MPHAVTLAVLTAALGFISLSVAPSLASIGGQAATCLCCLVFYWISRASGSCSFDLFVVSLVHVLVGFVSVSLTADRLLAAGDATPAASSAQTAATVAVVTIAFLLLLAWSRKRASPSPK